MRLFSKMMVVGALAFAGCDKSKEELGQVQQQLQTVTSERDSLKTQLEQAKADLTTAQKSLEEAKAQAAAAVTVDAGTPVAGVQAQAPAATKRPAAKRMTATERVEEKKMTKGGNSMNE